MIPTRQLVCMSRKHMTCSGHSQWVWLRWPTNTRWFVMLMGHAKWFEAYLGSFSPISTYSICLQFSRMPRCPDLAILVTTMTTDKTDYFTPCACTWGNNMASQQRRGGHMPLCLYAGPNCDSMLVAQKYSGSKSSQRKKYSNRYIN